MPFYFPPLISKSIQQSGTSTRARLGSGEFAWPTSVSGTTSEFPQATGHGGASNPHRAFSKISTGLGKHAGWPPRRILNKHAHGHTTGIPTPSGLPSAAALEQTGGYNAVHCRGRAAGWVKRWNRRAKVEKAATYGRPRSSFTSAEE